MGCCRLGRGIQVKQNELRIIGDILREDDSTKVLQRLNGFRAGLCRGKEVSPLRVKRINAWRELVKLYK